MPKVSKLHFYSLALCIALSSCSPADTEDKAQTSTDTASKHVKLVENIDQFNEAVKSLEPGDDLVLADGTWTDVEFVLKANGTADEPIELKAQTPGKVVITGQSNLAFSGEYIVISGLVFKNGSTPTGEVISFRTSNDDLANHSRVTNVVIDNFSTADRPMSDLWVAMYGKNNRLDHNSLVNKRNRGVTVAVRMNTEGSRKNNHLIEYNYFGPRQVLGANGGETLRIGTSHYSREYSNTTAQFNFFDRTNGEHEIISNKSSGNALINNVFFETQGTLTMRHGHFTKVEGNYFLGNRKPNTGGIRIINESQSVSNNYMYGLTGKRLRGALVIMNGVPNSPPNRYDPVIDSAMNNNIVIDSDHIELGAGSDEERSAPPTTSEFKGNIILGKTNLSPFTLYDDMSGINFEGNYLNEEASTPIQSGFASTPYSVTTNKYGLKSPDEDLLEEIGFGEVKLPVTKEEVGASYYPKTETTIAFQSGKTINVPSGTDTILTALQESQAGDILMLENGGDYLLTKFAEIHHPLTIMAAKGDKPIIRSQKPNFINIENGGALEVENLWFDGAESPDYKGNNIISTSSNSMNINYLLYVRNVKVTDLDVNGYFYFFKANAGTFADTIEILDSEFTNITGAILQLNREVDDLGVYSVENLVISGNTFTDIKEEVATVYRGGTDESTFGPIVTVSNNTLTNVGKGPTHRSGASMYFHGVQKLNISNTTWDKSAPLELFLTNGDPVTVIKDVVMKDTGHINANNNGYKIDNVVYK
ncbi:polysaccharide lyase 6 family protein [Paraglaciecola sp. 2405UD69-4]|uniref:polysaccharide lyase 6 family protein n=1 Tax=Paraglaciecola sp. 2405UD69-4 TaxID=3391836 RepID=UPI0039C8D427